ncbi:MAG: IS4 family transposase, partial [Burkholderiales bacterium]
MQSIFSNALSEAVAKHIDLSVTRRQTLSWLALLIMQHGTICLWRLAAYVASMAQTASVRRRFYRFFQFVRLDSALVARVVVDLLGLSGKPWLLAMDRTNWDFGKTTINILMISVTWNGIGIPLLWMLLPTAGNSHTSERTELLDRLRAAFPDMTIAALMGDREFIGDAWMAYLQRAKIPFILRLRENQYVLREGYAPLPLSVIARHLKVGEKMIVKGGCRLGRDNETSSAPVRLVVRRLAAGELLALACSGRPHHALARYRQRWTIETMFGNLKTKGFAMEATHLTDPDKLCTLLALLAFAVALSVKTGVARARLHAIPIKKHGRLACSLFALGLHTL